MRKRLLSVGGVLVAIAVAGASALAAQRSKDDRFSETTSVVAVEVPVQVIVEGQPVRGLTSDNFEVFDGRTRQQITGFEVIDLTTTEAAPNAAQPYRPPTVSPASRRHFLFLFDLSFSEPESLLRARKAAKEVVASSLHPADVVAVATYSLSKGPQLMLGFTPDRRQAEAVIDTLGAPELLDRNADPLLLAVADLEAPRVQGRQQSEARESLETTLLADLKEMAAQSEKSDRQNRVARVTALTRSFGDLARLLASIQGRKYVVYLSEGFDSKLLVGEESGDDLETTRAIESGEIWTVDSEARFGSSKTQNDLERMLEEFRRSDCVIQAVDIGGLRAGGDQRERASGQASLVTMAKDTGGDIYRNFNDLGQAMGQMLQRTSVTYVLVFQPDVAADGSYRRLEVKLKNGPRGARLVHRPGYYAPKTYQMRSATERQLEAAQAIVGGREGGELDLAVLAAPFRAPASGKAWVPVLLEVGGPSLFAGHSGDVLTTEIYVYAMDAQGNVRDFVVQSIGLDLKKTPPTLRQTGLKFFGHLDLEPGRYTLRAMARNGQTGLDAVRALELEVPATDAAAGVLLPPMFPEPMGKWLITRETVAQGEPQPAYPFMLKDAPYVPAAKPLVGSGAQQVALVGYNLAQADGFQMEVRTLDGQMVATTPLADVQRVPSSGGSDQLIASFRPQGLKPGIYSVSVSARQSGASVSSASVLVEVTASS